MAGDKSARTIIGVKIQATAGTFDPPGAADLIPCSSPENPPQPITAEDPTLTGALWSRPPAYLGATAQISATYSMRGPGAGGLLADTWVFGRIMRAAGFTEIVTAAAISGTAQAGNADASAIILAAAASAVDDFYLGMPIEHPDLGVGGMKGIAGIYDYDGASKTALIADTAAAAIIANDYNIPPHLLYLLGTGANLPLLSVSVWRDRLRYDYYDCAPSALNLGVPVANAANTELPASQFTLVGKEVDAEPTEEPAPTPTEAMLLPPPPAKNGKFTFNKARIGHSTFGIDFGMESGFQPNQNEFDGQESAELLSGSRSVSLDINQSDRPANLRALRENQTVLPIASLWGLGAGNRFMMMTPGTVLSTFAPSDRSGFIGLNGNAYPNKVDKSVSLAVW